MTTDLVKLVKEKIDIVEIVSKYVQLKKIGKNYKGLCPFHAEKTPSFIVSPEKNLAYCFGCQKGGDQIAFLQEVEGVDFKEALKILAERAGIRDFYDDSFHGEKKAGAKDKKLILKEIHSRLATFYSANLRADNLEAKKAREYLKNRGLDEETIKHFHLGLAYDSFESAYNHLLSLGFRKEDLLLAGVLVAKDTSSSQVFDRFRNRIIYPIHSHLGEIVAFAGRALSAETEAKYLNSPETLIFKKSNIFYNFKEAKPWIKEKNQVIIMEGYMDVIASSKAGVKNVVACLGTALSQEHIKTLKNIAKEICLCFDSDKAGINALFRALPLFQQLEISPKVIAIKGAKDPDELANKNPQELISQCLNPQNYFDFLLDYFFVKKIQTTEEKMALLREFLPLISEVKSGLELDEYLRKLASRLTTKPEILYKELKNLRTYSADFSSAINLKKKEAKKINLAGYFLGMIAAFPFLLKDVSEEKRMEYANLLAGNEKEVYLGMLSAYNNQASEEERKNLLPSEREENREFLILALYAEEKNANLGEDKIKEEFSEVVRRLLATRKKQLITELTYKLKEARESGKTEKSKELFQYLNTLLSS